MEGIDRLTRKNAMTQTIEAPYEPDRIVSAIVKKQHPIPKAPTMRHILFPMCLKRKKGRIADTKYPAQRLEKLSEIRQHMEHLQRPLNPDSKRDRL